MKSLFLAWQAPNRAWFPVGRLDADVRNHFYAFRYTKGALDAERAVGFKPLPAFPDFSGQYESSELFPLFGNRVLDPNRQEFLEYLKSLDLDQGHSDPINILSVSGGERQTDSLEVFPKVEKRADGWFCCRFFLHGIRHMRKDAQERAMLLQPGEALGLSLELNNPVTKFAILLTTRDYYFIGWTPRYLISDFLAAIADDSAVQASVVRVNQAHVPLNRRILVELSGKLPAGIEPMSKDWFQPIVGEPKIARH